MKVKVPATGSYAYSDVVALCGEPAFEPGEIGILLNPQVLIEVLSDSTERHDRGVKLQHYRSIENLREYVLVSQAEYRVERYARNAQGEWTYSDVTDPDGVADLTSINCRLSVARIYNRIFPKG